jgi:glycosyltransferase 2 family protein
MPSRRRRTGQVASGLVVTAAFVWLFVRDLPIDEFIAALASLTPDTVVAAVSFLAAAYTVRVVRWWVMLRSQDPGLRLRTCVWPLLTSVAVNNVFPLRAGDVLRVVAFRGQLRASASRVLGTLVLERLLDLVSLLLFLAVVLLAGVSVPLPEQLVPVTIAAVLVVALAIVALMLAGPPALQGIGRWLSRRPAIVARGRAAAIERLVTQLTGPLALARHPRRAAVLVSLSLAAWTLEGAVFAAVAVGLNLDVIPVVPWFAMAAGTLATLLPSGPGYLGTFDYAVREVVSWQGVPVGTAGAYAVAVHAALWVPLTAAGAFYLTTIGRGVWRRRTVQPSDLEDTPHAAT